LVTTPCRRVTSSPRRPASSSGTVRLGGQCR
jgi:hypothetical protein